MTVTFDHSWRLLALARAEHLAPAFGFRGGSTAEAAQEVTGATVADLEALADASWLRLDERGRYRVHELVRQYCAERLATEHTFRLARRLTTGTAARRATFTSILRLYVPHLLEIPTSSFAGR